MDLENNINFHKEGSDELNTREDYVYWLKSHGLSTTRQFNDLKMRINHTNLFPSLPDKLAKKQQENYKFIAGLNPLDIPPMTSPWTSDDTLYPTVTAIIFASYCSRKREGSLGQQEKVYAMLTSRKIVSVKCLKLSEVLIVAMP